MESKSKQHQTMTSFSVSDILGNTADSRHRSRDTCEDVAAVDPEMTSSPPPTHNAVVNEVRAAGGGNLQWLQVLQQHPTCEY